MGQHISQEGTTQGESMYMYALGIVPLIQPSSIDVNHASFGMLMYVDAAAATGTVLNLKE